MNATTPRPEPAAIPSSWSAPRTRSAPISTARSMRSNASCRPASCSIARWRICATHSGEWSRNIGEAVRRHPVPIVLAVAGIGWLVASSFRGRSGLDDDTFGDESPYADPPPRRARFYDGVGNRFARAADATRERTRRTRYQVVSTIERQPLLLGGLAIAVGALLGAVMPATEYEDKVVGQTARPRSRAREKGRRAPVSESAQPARNPS